MNTQATLLSIGAALGVLGLVPGALAPVAHASTSAINQQQPADPTGTVEIINVAGSVTVSGWDRPQVSVTGQIGDNVERVELSGSDHHTLVRVVLPHGSGDDSADLTIRVPTRSSLEVSLVNADLTVTGVSGSQLVRTVNGGVRLTVPDGTAAHIQTTNGDVAVDGAGGDVGISTVSGGGHLRLGSLRTFSLHTVSGHFDVSARLYPAALFTVESISGDVKVDFSGAPAAEFDLQSLSGQISNCTAQKATQPEFGPGSRLNFSTGDGQAHVRMTSTSGKLELCVR